MMEAIRALRIYHTSLSIADAEASKGWALLEKSCTSSFCPMEYLKQQLGRIPRIGFFRRRAETQMQTDFRKGRRVVRKSAKDKNRAFSTLCDGLEGTGLVERLQFESPQNDIERELAIIFEIAAGDVSSILSSWKSRS